MNAAAQFLQESYAELRKATWLSRREAVGSTLAVVTLVTLVSLFVASIDFVLSIVFGSILGGR
jgi:preprotein translocase SecE subunit